MTESTIHELDPFKISHQHRKPCSVMARVAGSQARDVDSLAESVMVLNILFYRIDLIRNNYEKTRLIQ